MQTRKYPRTMEEAFGPYARGPVQSREDTSYSWLWWIAMVIVTAVGGIVIWGTR